MATYAHTIGHQNSSPRALAMVLALVSAIVLSPLYVTHKNDHHHHQHHRSRRHYDTWMSSGFVLPMVLVGLIIAIRTTSSSSSTMQRGACGYGGSSMVPSSDPSWVLRIGSSSWGLGGVLVMLILVLSWQESVQDFFWR